MSETIGIIIIAVGLVFDLSGCIGLVRMPDVYTRLQSAAKCVTLGTCSTLLGVLIISGFTPTGLKAVVCIAFILMTSPAAAHAIARASHKFGVPIDKHAVVDKYEEEVDHHVDKYEEEIDRHEEGETP